VNGFISVSSSTMFARCRCHGMPVSFITEIEMLTSQEHGWHPVFPNGDMGFRQSAHRIPSRICVKGILHTQGADLV
jgi:hypothetical protein